MSCVWVADANHVLEYVKSRNLGIEHRAPLKSRDKGQNIEDGEYERPMNSQKPVEIQAETRHARSPKQAISHMLPASSSKEKQELVSTMHQMASHMEPA